VRIGLRLLTFQFSDIMIKIKLLVSNQYTSACLGRYFNVHFLCRDFFFPFYSNFLTSSMLMFWAIYLQINMQEFSKH
jgi:hypothetical protein